MNTKTMVIGGASVLAAILLAKYGFSRGNKIVPPVPASDVVTPYGGGGAAPPVYGGPAAPVGPVEIILPPPPQKFDDIASTLNPQFEGGPLIITPHAPMPISPDAFFNRVD